jgi:inner membrane protein
MPVPAVLGGARSGPLAVAGLAAVLGLDAVLAARHWPVPVVGLLDEPAHVLTAGLLVLGVCPRLRNDTVAWVLAGAVVIDLDHVPLYLWGQPVAHAGGRPVSHSLATAALLLLVAVPAAGRARRALVGLGTGVLLHLVRDTVSEPGVPLFWPLSPRDVELPYAVYGGLLAVATATAVSRWISGRRRVPQRNRRRLSQLRWK